MFRTNETEEISSPVSVLIGDIISDCLAPFLPPQSLGIMPLVCRSWFNIFTNKQNPSKLNLCYQLGVKEEVLNKLEELRKASVIHFYYPQMHQNYFRLMKNQEALRTNLNRDPTNAENQFFMLAACANHPSFLQMIPRERMYEYHAYCILAGTNCF